MKYRNTLQFVKKKLSCDNCAAVNNNWRDHTCRNWNRFERFTKVKAQRLDNNPSNSINQIHNHVVHIVGRKAMCVKGDIAVMCLHFQHSYLMPLNFYNSILCVYTSILLCSYISILLHFYTPMLLHFCTFVLSMLPHFQCFYTPVLPTLLYFYTSILLYFYTSILLCFYTPILSILLYFYTPALKLLCFHTF